jgi:enoyl-CoA hydratase
MSHQDLEIEKRQDIVFIYFNAPPANGLNMQMVQDLSDRLDELKESNVPVSCLIITSRVTDIFIAGADIKMIKAFMEGPDLVGDMVRSNTLLQNTINKIESLPFPVLAAINGHAMGGGLELALACDFRFMATGKARIGLPEVNLGLLPGAGGTQRLSRLIGKSRAKDIIFNARFLDAEAALSCGIVDRVFAPDALFPECMKYAEGLAGRAMRSIAVVKRCINQGLDGTMAQGLAIEMDAVKELLKTMDAQEGVSAFIEKRKPVFRGF